MPTFNGETLVIRLDSGVTAFGWIDVYSAWKDWLLEAPSNRGYPPAFDTSGGDTITATLDSGSYFFIRNDLGWRLQPPEEDISAYPTGNLIPSDVTLPVAIPTDGGFTAFYLGLQPITQAFSLSLESIADSVLDEIVEGTLTMRHILRLSKAFYAGLATGGGTTTVTFRDDANTKDRIVQTVDVDGNRTSVAVDGT